MSFSGEPYRQPVGSFDATAAPDEDEQKSQRARLHIREDEDDPHAEEKCGMPKKYKFIGILCVLLFFSGGFAVIIYNAIKGSGSGQAPPVLPPLTLDGAMFNRAIAPQYASLAWVKSKAPDADDGGMAVGDQFVSIVNGSFYLTAASAIDQPPTLIIAASDLNKFAAFTPPVAASQKKGRSLLSQPDDFDARGDLPDAARLHARARQAPAGAPTTPRALRQKPNHHQAHQPHSAQHDAHHAAHATHHQQSFASSVTEHLDADPTAPVFRFQTYALSVDQQHMLFGVNCTQLYRHSTFCSYLVFDLHSVMMIRLAGGAPLRLASWSPNADLIAYVQDNNVYTYSIAADRVTQVTADGLWDSIINGVADWVYEEGHCLREETRCQSNSDRHTSSHPR